MIRRRRERSGPPAEPAIELAPRWWRRQHDPDSSLYLPGGAAARNRLDRRWWLVSTVDGEPASVDPSGWVQLSGRSWMLGWWFRHGDRWSTPADPVSVRTTHPDGSPLVEVSVPVADGHVVARYSAVPRPGTAEAMLIVEFSVECSDPVGVAVAVAPWTPTGTGSIRSIDATAAGISVDGETAMLGERPARAVVAVASGSRLLDLLDADPVADPVAVTSPEGMASAALVWPMAHRTSMRVCCPLGRGHVEPGGVAFDALAPFDAVRSGWSTHLDAGAGIELPADAVDEATRSALGQLLAAWDGAGFGTEDPIETASAVVALAAFGHGGTVRRAVAALSRRVDDDAAGMTGVLMAAVAAGARVTVDRVDAEPGALMVPLARAVDIVHRGVRRRGAAWCPDALRGDLSEALGGAAELADAWDQPEVAKSAREARSAVAPTSPPESDEPPDPRSSSEESGIPWVRVKPGADLDLAATCDGIRRSAGPDALVHLAEIGELVGRIDAWPRLVHPTRPLGVGGSGASVATTAAYLRAVAASVVSGREEVALFPTWPDTWLGRNAEVRGLVHPRGTVSAALRWHGARPALIWEIEGDDVSVTAPLLDPNFRDRRRSAEALLEVPVAGLRRLEADADGVRADEVPPEAASTTEPADAADGGGGVTMQVDTPTRRRSG